STKARLPKEMEVVIVGNGPSALTMGYLLLGHQPYYAGGLAGCQPHPDPRLHALLSEQPANRELNLEEIALTNFMGSPRIVDPIARLLDALTHPLSDVGVGTPAKANQLRHTRKGPHWGIWAHLATSEMRALSHYSQLELPGLPFLMWRKTKNSAESGWRPGRKEVSQYYHNYAEVMGIARHCYEGVEVLGVRRTRGPFRYLVCGKAGGSQFFIRANHVVLATGSYTTPIPLQIEGSHLPGVYYGLDDLLRYTQPRRVLLVGTGLSAADALILHPLASCWKDDYPEYYRVYQLMRGAPCPGYEAFPDAHLEQLVPLHPQIEASLQLDGITHKRLVDAVLVLIGRRPNLELMSSVSATLTPDLHVYAIGALAGSTFRLKMAEKSPLYGCGDSRLTARGSYMA
ncbi:Oxidative stress-induced growth inhibitor 2, partial [Massospora cicadina]